jgi:ABC-2 type transport system ATP-binding protein
VVVTTPDVETALGILDGHLVSRTGDRLVVRGLRPEELTARLVAAGARVHEVAPERRSLEQVVLDVTSHGSDRVAGHDRSDR